MFGFEALTKGVHKGWLMEKRGLQNWVVVDEDESPDWGICIVLQDVPQQFIGLHGMSRAIKLGWVDVVNEDETGVVHCSL